MPESRLSVTDLIDPDDCQCKGIEQFVRSDTASEFTGVCVVCDLCGRQFELDDVSEIR